LGDPLYPRNILFLVIGSNLLRSDYCIRYAK
jgi:hypothetical protein